jgi:predicted ArsR family transcriptional regulator
MRAAGHLPIEDVLCSKIRMKILKVLVGSQLTPSQIAKKVGVNYVIAHKHLQVLEEAGLIEHSSFGRRIRYYRFSKSSSKAIAVCDLIDTFSTCCLRVRTLQPHT